MIDRFLRFAAASGIPAVYCPEFIRNMLDAHLRRRALVLQIHATAGAEVAFAAVWLAWACAVASLSPNSETVERVLRLVLLAAQEGAHGR